MGRLRILQFDVPAARFDEAVAFWAAALAAEPGDAPGAFVHLVDAAAAVEVHLQTVGDGPPRCHLDVEADDRHREAARLTAAGATHLGRFDAGGYTVLADPAGLPFCVVAPTAAAPTPVAPRRGDRGYLGAVVIDVPAAATESAVTFWSTALELDPAGVTAAPPFHVLPGVPGPGGAVQLLVQTVGAGTAARVHPDLIADAPDAEARRLVGLGARHLGTYEHWITLRDPVDIPFCVVAADQVATVD